MLFTTVSFLFYFLPLVLAGYFLLPSIRLKNFFLLFSSLIFYFWGEPRLVLVLLLSIGVNYIAGRAISASKGSLRSWSLAIAVAANLLILIVFKYADFLAEAMNTLLSPLGLMFTRPDIALPLGISFFTFQAMSYLIDVYRQRVPAERNPLDLGMYIAMFPQLVAGPIVRFESIAKQIHQRRNTLGRASIGARIFVIGLAQKVLIANQVALVADTAFEAAQPGMAEAWLGLSAYTLQIYFDFSGYSNMAIGLGLVFGFKFPRNFRVPYRSLSVTEFWRRWHISLSTWFRDYLYIPLGGNRLSLSRTYFNLATVFLLCGLWHGASWTFVIWGAHHGLLLILERAWLGKRLRRSPAWISRTYTLLAVMAAWVWFRAEDTEHALMYFGALIGANNTLGLSTAMYLQLHPSTLVALVMGVLLAMHPGQAHGLRTRMGSLAPRRPQAVIATVDSVGVMLLFALAVIFIAAGSYNPFLYFRF